MDKLINLGEIPIIQLRPLKMERNPYLPEDKGYFQKRKEKLVLTKFKAAIYKLYKHICPECGESLHNGERIELHHILPKAKGGMKNKKDNIMPLHQICHQQITRNMEETTLNEI